MSQNIIYSGHTIIGLMEQDKIPDLEDMYFHKLHNDHEVHFHRYRIESIWSFMFPDTKLKNSYLHCYFWFRKHLKILIFSFSNLVKVGSMFFHRVRGHDKPSLWHRDGKTDSAIPLSSLNIFQFSLNIYTEEAILRLAMYFLIKCFSRIQPPILMTSKSVFSIFI